MTDDRFRNFVMRVSNWTPAEVARVSPAQVRHVARVVMDGADPVYPPFGEADLPTASTTPAQVDRLSEEETARASDMLDLVAPLSTSSTWEPSERRTILRAMLAYGDVVAGITNTALDAAQAGATIPAGFSLSEREHDEECGCPEETWDTPYGLLNMHLSAGKPSNAVLDNGDAGEWSVDLTADTVDAARRAFFGWAQCVTYIPRAALSTPKASGEIPAGMVGKQLVEKARAVLADILGVPVADAFYVSDGIFDFDRAVKKVAALLAITTPKASAETGDRP